MRPALPVSATPVAFVNAIVQAYARFGVDPGPALQQAQIAPALLHQPQARITARQMEQFSGAAMLALNDEALGWFSRRLPWGSYGMLARASISAPTLGLALQRWCRHHGLIAPDIALDLSVAAGVATIRITERMTEHCKHAPSHSQSPPPSPLSSPSSSSSPPLPTASPHQQPNSLPPAMREFCLVSVLRNIHGLACWLVDSRIALLGAQFPFLAPPHSDAYAVLFGGHTTFGADYAHIRFDAHYLALPLRRDEAALQHMLQHALPLTVLQYRRDRLLVQRVRQALASHPQLAHNGEALAALLHCSPRSLHRQLKDEGATLQGLKDEVRRTRAAELLHRTQRPIKQVAQACGFANEKSFIRAFKGWWGVAPGEFRNRPAHLSGTPPSSHWPQQPHATV